MTISKSNVHIIKSFVKSLILVQEREDEYEVTEAAVLFSGEFGEARPLEGVVEVDVGVFQDPNWKRKSSVERPVACILSRQNPAGLSC